MADNKDPFSEFGGSEVKIAQDPFAEFGGETVKKKEPTTEEKGVQYTNGSTTVSEQGGEQPQGNGESDELLDLPQSYKSDRKNYSELIGGKKYKLKRGGVDVFGLWDAENQNFVVEPLLNTTPQVKPRSGIAGMVEEAVNPLKPKFETEEDVISRNYSKAQETADVVAKKATEIQSLTQVPLLQQLDQLKRSGASEEQIKAVADTPIESKDIPLIRFEKGSEGQVYQNLNVNLPTEEYKGEVMGVPLKKILPEDYADVKTIGELYDKVNEDYAAINDYRQQIDQFNKLVNEKRIENLPQEDKEYLSKIEGTPMYEEELAKTLERNGSTENLAMGFGIGLSHKLKSLYSLGDNIGLSNEQMAEKQRAELAKEQLFGVQPKGAAEITSMLGSFAPDIALGAVTGGYGAMASMLSTLQRDKIKEYYANEFSKGVKTPDQTKAWEYATASTAKEVPFMLLAGKLAGVGGNVVGRNVMERAYELTKDVVKRASADAFVFGGLSGFSQNKINKLFDVAEQDDYIKSGLMYALMGAGFGLAHGLKGAGESKITSKQKNEVDYIASYLPENLSQNEINNLVKSGKMLPSEGEEVTQRMANYRQMRAQIPTEITFEQAEKIYPLWEQKIELTKQLDGASGEFKKVISGQIEDVDKKIMIKAGVPLTGEERAERQNLIKSEAEQKPTDKARLKYLNDRNDAAKEVKEEKKETIKRQQEEKAAEEQVVEQPEVVSEQAVVETPTETVTETTQEQPPVVEQTTADGLKAEGEREVAPAETVSEPTPTDKVGEQDTQSGIETPQQTETIPEGVQNFEAALAAKTAPKKDKALKQFGEQEARAKELIENYDTNLQKLKDNVIEPTGTKAEVLADMLSGKYDEVLNKPSVADVYESVEATFTADLSDSKQSVDEKKKSAKNKIIENSITSDAAYHLISRALDKVDGLSVNNIFDLAKKIAKLDNKEILIEHIAEAIQYEVGRVKGEKDTFSLSIGDAKDVLLNWSKDAEPANKTRMDEIGIVGKSYRDRINKLRVAKKQYELLDDKGKAIIKAFLNRYNDTILEDAKLNTDEYLQIILDITKGKDLVNIAENIQNAIRVIEDKESVELQKLPPVKEPLKNKENTAEALKRFRSQQLSEIPFYDRKSIVKIIDEQIKKSKQVTLNVLPIIYDLPSKVSRLRLKENGDVELLDNNDKKISGNKITKDKFIEIALQEGNAQRKDAYNISEAYHRAKLDGTNPELVKAVEDLLGKPSAAKEPTQATEQVEQAAEKVNIDRRPTTMPDGDDGVELFAISQDGTEKSIGKFYADDTTEIEKAERNYRWGQEQKAKRPQQATEVEVTQPTGDKVGKTVAFEHAGGRVSGVVVAVDEKGNLKVEGVGTNKGTKFTVKPTELYGEVTEQMVEAETKNKELEEKIKTRLGKKKEPPKGDKLMKSVIGSQQFADIPNRLVQNWLSEKVRGLENYVAKTVQRASVSDNVVKRNIADFITSLSRGIMDTQEYSQAKRQKLTGEIGKAKLDVEDFHADLWDLIGGDINSADRVHQVLDPEVSGTGLKYDDLTDAEKDLHDLLRDLNDYTHNQNFLLGKISQETYDKYKDKYIGRDYVFDDKPDQTIGGRSIKEVLGIYKQRKDLDQAMKDAAVKDPIYLTLKRYLQTAQNKAIADYSDWIFQNHGENNVLGNAVFVSDTPKDGFIKLGKGYGALSNKYVARNVAEDFGSFVFNNEFMSLAYDAFKAYDGLPPRQFMKELLTVGNPQVQLGNWTSNIVFSWLGGVDFPTYISKSLEARKQIKERGDVYRFLTDEGLLGSDFISKDLKPMETVIGGEPTTAFGKARKKLRSVYSGVDDAAKIQMFLSLKDMGYTDQQAVTIVFESMQNYQNTGRIWDFASKTPIIGNSFVKFTPEMLRLLKNGMTRRPLHTLAFISMLSTLPSIIGKNMGDEDEEIDAAAKMKGIPKITIPYTDLNIPLSWRIGDKRVNLARFLMPMYIYDIGGESRKATEFVNKFMPYQLKETETGGLTPFNVQDPFVAPIISILQNKDFRDKPIVEETDNSFDATLKRLRYATRGYGGFYANMIDDIFSTAVTDEDFYGRRKTALDVALNTLIKVETFDDERLKQGVIREFDGYERMTDKLYRAYTTKRKKIDGEVKEIKKDKTLSEERKKELIAMKQQDLMRVSSNVLEEVADVQKEMIEATEFYRNLSRKQKYSEISGAMSEAEKTIKNRMRKIDGKFVK